MLVLPECTPAFPWNKNRWRLKIPPAWWGPPAKLLWESLRLAPSTSRHDKCHGSIHGNVQNWRTSLVGGFNPSEKYWSKWESSSNRGENKKYLKPPPRSPMSFAKKTRGFENFMKKTRSLSWSSNQHPRGPKMMRNPIWIWKITQLDE